MMMHVSKEFKSYEIPSPIGEFIAWLDKQIEETGVARNEIEIEIEAYSDYGDPSASLYLNYNREETAQEEAVRLADVARRADYEKKELARLKAKYGDV